MQAAVAKCSFGKDKTVCNILTWCCVGRVDKYWKGNIVGWLLGKLLGLNWKIHATNISGTHIMVGMLMFGFPEGFADWPSSIIVKNEVPSTLSGLPMEL